MKKTDASIFLFYVVLVGAFALPNVRVTHGAPYVSMRVEQVVWGTSPDSPIIVNPGDVNDPLTVVVRNLAEDKTIKGVYAKITLKYPFKSSAGGFEAEAVGQPTEGEILNPTEEVSPAGSFSFTFRIDIDQDAKPGTYYHTMTVYYAVKDVGGKYAEGQPQMLLVKMYLPDRAPVIDSFTPMQTNPSLYVGDQLNFSSRSHDPDGDDLTYTWLVDGNNVSILSFFIYTPNTKDLGTHTVELRVSDGNLTISQTWSVLVDKIKTMEVVVSDNFLIGGSRNLLNITLKNNFWKGVVRVDLATSQPTSAQSLVV
ncbi:MAG: hypothetical protein FJ045_03745, partial [Crenarchaeota archaeon]|nr:hypothetical protein [Thermoproteota archaeon]